MIAVSPRRGQDWIAASGLAMGALVALGPLELRDAGLQVAGLLVSLPELLSALAVCAALVAVLLSRTPASTASQRRTRLAVTAVLGAWALVALASAAWAPADRTHVVKYGLRAAGGVSLAIAAYWLAPHAVFRRRFTAGLLVSLGILTVLGLLERGFGRSFEPFLRLFRDEPTWMLGEQRLSTVFSHANTCAAFLELTAPMLVVAAAARGQRPYRRVLLLGWLLLVAVLLSLTYSRAGLVAGMVGAGLLAYSARRQRDRRALVVVALGYAAAVGTAYVANPDMRARIGLTERSYRATYRARTPCMGHAGERAQVQVTVRNRGEWALSNRQAPGSLMSTLMTRQGRRVGDWRSTPLPDMPHGARADVPVMVSLPERPGTYLLAIDVARDEVLRISALGNPMAYLTCVAAPPGTSLARLKAPSMASAQPLDASEVAATRRMELERKHYWWAAWQLVQEHPLLGLGADRFRLEYRRFVPAEAYDPRARAHSVIVETAVDLGVPGLLALLGLGILLIGSARVAIRVGWRCHGRREVGGDGLTLGAAAGLCGFAVHSQVDYFLGYTQVAILFWPMLGLLCGAVWNTPGGTGREGEADAGGERDDRAVDQR